MKKRILSMILAIIMVAGLLPGFAMTASAAETEPPTDYTITIAEDITGGTIQAPTSAEAGEEVILTISPDDGYQLYYIEINGEYITPSGETEITFTMPEEDVNIFAEFVEGIVVYFDNTDSQWKHVICYNGKTYLRCDQVADNRHVAIVPAGKPVQFTNYMPGMPESEFPGGYFHYRNHYARTRQNLHIRRRCH